jgi:hypothetical protein
MRKWVFLLSAAVLVWFGIWAWDSLFPSPAKVIRKRLVQVARLASFSSREGALAAAGNVQELLGLCTEDIEVQVKLSGRYQETFSGRDALRARALGVRSVIGGLQVEFLDINVTIAPDGVSADADLTVKGVVPGERETIYQEVKFFFRKVGGAWLIRRVETVKSLSLNVER